MDEAQGRSSFNTYSTEVSHRGQPGLLATTLDHQGRLNIVAVTVTCCKSKSCGVPSESLVLAEKDKV